MSDFRFGFDDYSLNYYPHDASDDDGIDWEKVDGVEIDWVDFVRKRECEFRPFPGEDASEPNAMRGVCSECSALMFGKDNYCPNCGAHVKAVKR